MKLLLTRDVTPAECPWLSRTFIKDEIVYRFDGYTYGCISPGGIACSLDGAFPFFELPRSAVDPIGE